MTARRRIIVVASVLVAIGLAAIAGQAIGEIPKTRFPSCLSPQPEGLLAFRRLLDDLVIPTVVFDRPWSRLNEQDDQPPGLLIVALPLRRAVLNGESHELERWVRQGGSLLVVDDAGQNEEDAVLAELLRRIGIETYRQSTDLDPATLSLERPARTAASGTGIGPGSRDVRRVMMHEEAGLVLGGTALPLLLDDDDDVLAAETRLGDGRLVITLGPLLANDRLLDGDALRFALSIVEELRGNGPVRFDEFHQGRGGLLVSFEGLDRTALFVAGAQALIALVLYSFSRGVRFGPPRPAAVPTRRSSREFVDAMASMYRRAEARRHALRATLDRVIRELRARFELEEALGTVEVAREVERRTRSRRGALRVAVETTERALRSPRLGDREMIAAARELVHAREEVIRGDRSGP